MRVNSIQEIVKSENRKKREYSKKLNQKKENKESFSKVLKFEIEKWKGEK